MLFGIPNPFPGLFLVFEGIDGSGKSTQMELAVQYLKQELVRLADRLKTRGQVITTKEPDVKTLVGRRIYEELGRGWRGLHQTDPIAFQAWYATESRERMENFVIPHLKLGDIVVSDRYRTSLVYGVRGDKTRQEDLATLLQLNWSIMGYNFIWPDLTILFDVSAEEAVARMKKMGKQADGHERLEKLRLVRRNYLHLDVHCKVPNLLVNNHTGKPEEIFPHYQVRLDGALVKLLRE